MAAIQFPNNPNAGDLFNASNGIRYTYDGEKWKTLGTSTAVTGGNQFVETPKTLTVDKVIAANTNAGAVGTLVIGSNAVLTVPSTSTFRTLLGRSGSGGGGVQGLPTSGGTMTGTLTLAADPVANLQAATKQYVDSVAASGGGGSSGLPLTGGTLTGALTLAADPVTNLQAATKQYVDSAATSGGLPLTGGTLTGALTLAADPVANLQAATKQYVDSVATSGGLPISGGTMTGALTLAADPVTNLQAATKQYVDSNATLVADGGNFNTGYSLVSASSTFDGGSFD